MERNTKLTSGNGSLEEKLDEAMLLEIDKLKKENEKLKDYLKKKNVKLVAEINTHKEELKLKGVKLKQLESMFKSNIKLETEHNALKIVFNDLKVANELLQQRMKEKEGSPVGTKDDKTDTRITKLESDMQIIKDMLLKSNRNEKPSEKLEDQKETQNHSLK
ncbi:hypothetical protein HHI36_017649 [Cryptolaemus montrouzieri]|uniref:Uncharacterized protein n=1 Tax=Cryptolaemus montrouzieri TaxID=559131 RepID=A0ABD2NNE8_9CUCU